MRTTAKLGESRPLSGTVALITGASSGIGQATAETLAGEGASVVIVGRRADRVAAVADEINRSGGTALAVPVDISRREQAEESVRRAIETYGRLDILVNSAGHGGRAAVEDSDPADWDAMLAVNVQGALYVIHAALPHLMKAARDNPRQVADIVNISSLVSRVVWANYASYSMTKAGLNAFTKSMREELADKMVRTSLVEPGATATEMVTELATNPTAATAPAAGFKWLESQDVADAVRYIVTRPAHVSINELLVRPTEQSFAPAAKASRDPHDGDSASPRGS